MKKFDKIAIDKKIRPIFEHAYHEYANTAYHASKKLPSRGEFIRKLVEHWNANRSEEATP